MVRPTRSNSEAFDALFQTGFHFRFRKVHHRNSVLQLLKGDIIVPALSTPTLISIGQLCDAGCDVQFDKTTVTVTYQDNLVLQGTRTRASKLWHFNLPVAPPTNQPSAGLESANTAIGGATPADLVDFAHASMFSPALSTLESAVKKGFLTNFPGLTLSTLRKHPPKSVAMVKGHLDQSRKNQRSTKPSPSTTPVPVPTITLEESE